MKDFIPFKEAFELKQLGFDEPCFGHFLNKKFYLKSFDRQGDGITLRPTWQQAFRWFREKYKLVHDISENPKEMIDYVASKGERYLPTYRYGYSSGGCYHPIGTTYVYEEAEIGCLRKFIEIVKQNNDKPR
jgi:hypothetical protein